MADALFTKMYVVGVEKDYDQVYEISNNNGM